MLKHLYITNYALIDRLELNLQSGLNLLSGETGSGKSILVDALGLLLGNKASPEMVRTGSDRASISGVFQIQKIPELNQFLDDLGLLVEDHELILKREISREGKSRAFINQQPTTAATLKNLGHWLVDIHGQNEQQALTEAEAQLNLLDAFARHDSAREELSSLSAEISVLRAKKDSLEQNETDRNRLLDLLNFQRQEIEAARLQPREDETLNVEHRLLANASKLYETASEVSGLLYESEGSAAQHVAAAEKTLESMARIDEKLQVLLDQLRTTRIQVEDVAASMRAYLQKIDARPEKLEQVESRLAEIEKLRRKYGSTVEDILRFYDQVVERLSSLENRDEELKRLADQWEQLTARYKKKAEALSAARQRSASSLEKRLERELQELAMERTRFKIKFSGAAVEFSPLGIDAVEYLLSPNPGEELKPLSKIASGGEISRLMLALKTITQADSKIKTLVFDEVDSGIGGRTAEVLGRKLKGLAQHNQILCVTHLPQIASFADHHYFVEKVEQRGRTVTRIEYLREAARINELARMLSGAKITDAVKEHARELIKQSRD
ncbi:MAG: DNA repair protein RecN [Acidobacteriia bacterium]|nr:DNA repair protein RecN [Terriglobia bacterium]